MLLITDIQGKQPEIQQKALQTMLQKMKKVSKYRKYRTKVIISYLIRSERKLHCMNIMDENINHLILEFHGVLEFDTNEQMKLALWRYIALW